MQTGPAGWQKDAGMSGTGWYETERWTRPEGPAAGGWLIAVLPDSGQEGPAAAGRQRRPGAVCAGP
jgi:hypothetical protein